MVSIIGIFEEVLGDAFGKLSCYNSVDNWMRKLWLSVFNHRDVAVLNMRDGDTVFF